MYEQESCHWSVSICQIAVGWRIRVEVMVTYNVLDIERGGQQCAAAREAEKL